MLKTIKRIITPVTAFVTLSAVPFMARAAGEVQSGLSQISSPFSFGGSITHSDNIIDLIANVISLLLFVAGAVAVVFIIVGGYRYITSAGNEETAEKGKNTVVNAVIGIAVIILSYVIINAIVGTINRF